MHFYFLFRNLHLAKLHACIFPFLCRSIYIPCDLTLLVFNCSAFRWHKIFYQFNHTNQNLCSICSVQKIGSDLFKLYHLSARNYDEPFDSDLCSQPHVTKNVQFSFLWLKSSSMTTITGTSRPAAAALYSCLWHGVGTQCPRLPCSRHSAGGES